MTQTFDHPGLQLFAELLDIPAPSGYEARLIEELERRIRKMGYTPEVDAGGNLLVRINGRAEGPLTCLAAHVDEIGMVVQQIHTDGSLSVDRLGGLFPWKIGEGPVEILGDCETVVGVLSMGSGHARSNQGRTVDWSGVRLLTGLTVDELRERGIRRGSPAVPVRSFRGPHLFGSPDAPMVAAWSFDNRLGVVSQLQLLEQLAQASIEPHVPLLVAFTVEEEIGCFGAKGLAVRERPDVLIAVDGSPLIAEYPLALDGRPGIRSKDRVSSYDQDLLREISRLSLDAGVELQPVVYDCAGSDASAAYAIGAVPRVACLGYVRESSHGYEVAPLATFDHLLTTLVAIAGGFRG